MRNHQDAEDHNSFLINGEGIGAAAVGKEATLYFYIRVCRRFVCVCVLSLCFIYVSTEGLAATKNIKISNRYQQ